MAPPRMTVSAYKQNNSLGNVNYSTATQDFLNNFQNNNGSWGGYGSYDDYTQAQSIQNQSPVPYRNWLDNQQLPTYTQGRMNLGNARDISSGGDDNRTNWNFADIGAGLQGLGALAQGYAAIKQNNLAKKQFKFTKEFAQKNLANQTQSYNTALAAQANWNASILGNNKGWNDEQRAQYVKDFLSSNRLPG